MLFYFPRVGGVRGWHVLGKMGGLGWTNDTVEYGIAGLPDNIKMKLEKRDVPATVEKQICEEFFNNKIFEIYSRDFAKKIMEVVNKRRLKLANNNNKK